MKKAKIINFEDALQKQEAIVIQECSSIGDHKRVTDIIIRRIWRQERGAKLDVSTGESVTSKKKDHKCRR